MGTPAPKVKPDGPSDMFCPQWQKPMSEVCRTCGWWTELEHRDEEGQHAGFSYECAMNITAFGTMKTAKEVRCNTASTDKTANAVHRMHNNMAETNMKLIEGLKPALQVMARAPALSKPQRYIENERDKGNA